ncbi:MAG: 5-oxoprolinase subunit PxpA [Bacteroidota bacterium]
MPNRSVDINCDVGEGLNHEAQLFPFISSCSIACGGHAGDIETMRETAVLAKKYNLKVGAHPSYPDRKNFGRVSMELSEGGLRTTIIEQIDLLAAILKEQKIPLHHIKPHGALYNDVAQDAHLAKIMLKALAKYKDTISLYVPYASKVADQAKANGYKILYEAFGDRKYHGNLKLVSRKIKDAVIQDPKQVLNQIINIINRGKVATWDGGEAKILADTLCIHGDTPSALQIVSYLHEELPRYRIFIQK